MPYVYRYIDMAKKEIIYVGKVKGFKDTFFDPLLQRHNQHKNDAWYREHDGKWNIAMQFIQCDSHADADALETLYISLYDETGQLENKAKRNWGKTSIDLSTFENQWSWYEPPTESDKCSVFDEFNALVDKQLGNFHIKLADFLKVKFPDTFKGETKSVDDLLFYEDLEELIVRALRIKRFQELQKYGKPPYKRRS